METGQSNPSSKARQNKNMTSGYRPISILPVVTKVIEKHVKKIILDHLTNYAPISPRQWGVMETRSTISTLIKVVDDWSRALDQGKEVSFILSSFSYQFSYKLCRRKPHSSMFNDVSAGRWWVSKAPFPADIQWSALTV